CEQDTATGGICDEEDTDVSYGFGSGAPDQKSMRSDRSGGCGNFPFGLLPGIGISGRYYRLRKEKGNLYGTGTCRGDAGVVRAGRQRNRRVSGGLEGTGAA